MNLGHFAERLRVGRDMSREHFAVTVDDGEQVVEIVCDATRQPADRIEPLRVHERFVQPAAFRLIAIGRDHVRDAAARVA